MASPVQDPQLQKVLKDQQAALGGARRLDTLGPLLLSGSRSHQGFMYNFSWWVDNNGNMHEEAVGEGLNSGFGIFKETAWVRHPNAVRIEEPAQDVHPLRLLALMMSRAWLSPEKYGLRLGRPVQRPEDGLWRLPIDSPGGFSATLYFNARTHLLVRAVTNELNTRFTYELSDYRKVRGVLIPHDITRVVEQGPIRDVSSYQITRATPMDAGEHLLEQARAEQRPVLPCPAGGTPLTLPTRIMPDTGMPLVQVGLPSEAPTWFLLDSASDVSVVDPDVLARYKLPVVERLLVGDERNSFYAPLVLFSALGLGDAQLERPYVVGVSLEELRASTGVQVDGILGADLFARCVISLNYQKQEVTLISPESFSPPPSLPPLPMDSLRRVTASLHTPDGKPVTRFFSLDTGNVAPVAMSADLGARFRLEPPIERRLQGESLGAGGRVGSYLGRNALLTFGNFRIPNPLVSFERIPAPPVGSSREAGLLGLGVLRRFNIIFDLPGGRVYFEQNMPLNTPFAYNRSGLSIQLEGALRVTGVRPGLSSPVAIGDRLLGVKVGDVWERRSDVILKMLNGEPGQRLPVELSRNGSLLQVEITLEDWL